MSLPFKFRVDLERKKVLCKFIHITIWKKDLSKVKLLYGDLSYNKLMTNSPAHVLEWAIFASHSEDEKQIKIFGWYIGWAGSDHEIINTLNYTGEILSEHLGIPFNYTDRAQQKMSTASATETADVPF